jgi:exosortase/archaeosortase family protein
MKKGMDRVIDIIVRYTILIIIGIIGIKIFYTFFSALTLYPVYALLKLFFTNISMLSNVIMINNLPIEIIGPCVAGSAYYLLLILNLSIPKIEFKKRIELLFFTFSSLLIINILRIFLLSVLFVSGTSFFDITHKLFWYAGSTIFVVGIWFLGVKIFKVKEIPFYSDIKFLLSNYKKKGKKKKSKK